MIERKCVMKKRIIAVLLMIVMVGTFVSCSCNDSEKESQKSTEKEILTKNEKQTTTKADEKDETTKKLENNTKESTMTTPATQETTTLSQTATKESTGATTGVVTGDVTQVTTAKNPVAAETTKQSINETEVVTTKPMATEEATTQPQEPCSHSWSKMSKLYYVGDNPIIIPKSGEVPVYYDWGVRECSCDVCKASPFYVELKVATLAYEGVRQDCGYYEDVLYDGYSIIDNNTGGIKTINKDIRTIKGVDIVGLKVAYETWGLYDPSIYSFEQFVYGINPHEGFQEREAYSCGIDNVQNVFGSNDTTTISSDVSVYYQHIVFDYCTKCGLNQDLSAEEARLLDGVEVYNHIHSTSHYGYFGKCRCEGDDWIWD